MSQSEIEQATAAAKSHDVDVLRERVDASPALVSALDHEEHTLLDHAMWGLLVGDYSRPPTIAQDPDGRGMACVRVLLDAGSDVNARNADGWTPLHTAQYCNHVELTRELLLRGADVTAEAHAPGGTPVLQALFWGHAEAADELVRSTPAAVTPRNLRVGAGLGMPDVITEMFDENSVLRPAAFEGRRYYRPHTEFPDWSATHDRQEVLDEAFTYAARNGRLAALEDLHARGAAIDGGPYNGSALHWAAALGRIDVCTWLLDHGGDPNVRATHGTQSGVTPLHACVPMNRIAAARLLLARGADPSLLDESHESTPAGWAEFFGCDELADVLRA